ncbi:hypothetical protein CCM_03093 [Cordyceps militaris CM01]|uniref:Uncharacterized protein n=1 Tax=Cordyceps militaris (strain CM01) TaxID=983644 RepID=G3J8T9_CORMM|nr:uncharacterized protein CCM_03093 [Cordyceps militaris CM01]EGX94822.1 hypothetical protein CCM_03093 [Cordyceps militaris CM01]
MEAEAVSPCGGLAILASCNKKKQNIVGQGPFVETTHSYCKTHSSKKEARETHLPHSLNARSVEEEGVVKKFADAQGRICICLLCKSQDLAVSRSINVSYSLLRTCTYMYSVQAPSQTPPPTPE